ncbi:hypothetical protein JCM6882_005627 [Rhodosporidiobolus microsporus]
MPPPPPVVPYDPPLSRPSSRASRSSRSSRPPPPSPHPQESIFDRLHDGFEIAEHVAGEVEYAAGQVGKAAGVGERILGDVEEAYGGGGYAGVPQRGRQGGYETTTDGESTDGPPVKEKKAPSSKAKSPVVAYQPVTTPKQSVRQRKAAAPRAEDDLASFERDLDTVQETVDDLSDLVESIAVLRHRLTGAPYPRIAKLLRLGRQPHPLPRSPAVERDEATHLAALVSQAKHDLLEQYKRVRWMQGRYHPLADKLRARVQASPAKEGAKTYARVQKHMLALNAAFAALLDFVEDRAKDERKDVEGGDAEQRLLGRMKEERPEWRREKRVAEAKNAREKAKGTSLEKVADISSYTAWWFIDNPFTGLDGVLQTIDHAENGIASKKDEKTGSWALGSLLSGGFHHSKSSRSSTSKQPKAMLEVGKSHEHRYHSEEKPSHGDGLISSDEDDLSAEEKKLLAPPGSGNKKRKVVDGVDLSQLPERVPTDDTSGYQETAEELVEDAKDQSRTEHLYTPLLVLWWAAITCLYLYWAIARAVGFANPLGNVDLGSHLGNSAWNDTSDGLVRTSASSSSFSETSTSSSFSSSSSSFSRYSHVQPTGPSDVPLSEVQATASAMREVESSVSEAVGWSGTRTTAPVETGSSTVSASETGAV